MVKKLSLVAFLLVFLGSFALAQAEPIDIDISKTSDIFYAGIAGFGVLALVEIIKRALKTHGVLTVFVSIVVSAAATLYYLITAAGFSLLKFIVLTAIVALAANGIYLFPRKRET